MLEQVSDVLVETVGDFGKDVEGGVGFAVLDVGEMRVVHADHLGEAPQRDPLALPQDADVTSHALAVAVFVDSPHRESLGDGIR